LERGVKEERTHIQFEDIKQRFGLVEKPHRIGEIDINPDFAVDFVARRSKP
jgi:hypothetical protein